jgi:DNA-binding LytR/AlgR family response regulator
LNSLICSNDRPGNGELIGMPVDSPRSRVSAWENRTIVNVRLADVVYAAKYTSAIVLHMKDGRKLPSANCEQIKQLIQSDHFVQVRHTKFVNPRHVRKIVCRDNGKLVMRLRDPYSEIEVVKSRTYSVRKFFATELPVL